MTPPIPLALLPVVLLSLATPAKAQRVAFEQPGYRLRSIGERVATRLVDPSGKPVASTGVTFRVSDPTVASVTVRGEVISRKEGLTKVWAVTGRDSASAIVLVEQWAAKFSFNPTLVRLDALAAKIPLRVQLRDSAGVPIASQPTRSPCKSLNERIASVSPAGEVTAVANGGTYIRCADRGLADSVRVEVQQRAATLKAATQSVNKSVGDTFSVRVTATDRQKGVIAGARAVWVSLNPAVVTIDPTTGKALSRGQGQTRVIAQLDDAADTIMVNVSSSANGLMQLAVAAPDTTTPVTKPAAAKAQLSVNSMSMEEGETRRLLYSVKDSLNVAVPEAKVLIRSGDTSIVVVTAGDSIVGLKPGDAFVTVLFGVIKAEARVSVRAKGSSLADTSAARIAAAGSDFRRPVVESGLAAKYAAQRDTAMKTITTSTGAVATRGRWLNGGLVFGTAAHSSNQVAAGSAPLIEDRTGVMYGGRAEMQPFTWLSLSGDYRRAQLATPGAIGESMSMTDIGGEAILYLMPSLGFGGGYSVRGERTALSTQKWTIPRATITGRINFVGNAVTTVTSLSFLPGAQISGSTTQKPDMGVGGEAGLEFHRGRLDAGVSYYIDRFTFAELAGSSRVDQFSALRIRLGFQLNR